MKLRFDATDRLVNMYPFKVNRKTTAILTFRLKECFAFHQSSSDLFLRLLNSDYFVFELDLGEQGGIGEVVARFSDTNEYYKCVFYYNPKNALTYKQILK